MMPRRPEEQLPPWVGTRDPLDKGVFIPPHQPGDKPRGPFEPIPVPQALPAQEAEEQTSEGPEPPAPASQQAAPSIPFPEPRRPSAAPSIQAAVLASQPRRSAAASIPAATQERRREAEYPEPSRRESPQAPVIPPPEPVTRQQGQVPETLGQTPPKALSGAAVLNFGGPSGGGTAGDSRELIDAIEGLTNEVKQLRESIERDRPGRGNVVMPGRKPTEVEYPSVRGGGAAPSLPKREK